MVRSCNSRLTAILASRCTKRSSMISVHLKKLRKRTEISPEEERAIRSCRGRNAAAPGRQDRHSVRRGTEHEHDAARGLDGAEQGLQSGERQVTELHVAGDFADLHAFTLKRLDHDVMTLSECTVAIVPHERLQDITRALSASRSRSIGFPPTSMRRSTARWRCRSASGPRFRGWRICFASFTSRLERGRPGVSATATSCR